MAIHGTESPGYLTPAQAAERVQVSPRTMARWIRTGVMPVVRVGRVVRIDARELDRSLRRTA